MHGEKWIFWDLGGVLIDFRFAEWCKAMGTFYGCNASEIEQFWITSANGLSPHHKSDLGLLDETEIWMKFSEAFGESRFTAFQCTFTSGYNGRIEPVYRLVQKLMGSEQIHLGLISNVCSPHLAFARGNYPEIFQLFHPSMRFYSCCMEMRKETGTKLFSRIFSMGRAEPHASWLVDDMQENIEAFRASGGNGIHFENPEQLARVLMEHNLL